MFSNSFGLVSHSMSDLKASLGAGNPVGLGILLTPSFYAPNKNGVVSHQPVALPNSGHAVLAVGIGEEESSGETHLLLRNSWGLDWGVGGHAWISASYVNTHALCAFGR
jgi:C1A family cysteine protease